MPQTLLRFHEVRPGDTPASLARRYGLSSWVAVVKAPINNELWQAETEPPLYADSALEVGIMLRIPPDARALLKDRVYELLRIQALLQRHFHEQDRIFNAQVVPLEVVGPLDQRETVKTILDPMIRQVHSDVVLAHEAAKPFAEINDGLASTHLYNQGDLSRYAGSGSEFVGLNWLLTPGILELWYGMWAPEFWASRWRGRSLRDAKQAMAVHLNLVRSKVLQQTDLRLREAHMALWRLDAEND